MRGERAIKDGMEVSSVSSARASFASCTMRADRRNNWSLDIFYFQMFYAFNKNSDIYQKQRNITVIN